MGLNTHEPCIYCGGMALRGTTCPRSIECPTCHAPSGSSCRRPSGHRAAELHSARVQLAESIPIRTDRTYPDRRDTDEGART